MKKYIFLGLFFLIFGSCIYIYHNYIIKNYQSDIISYEYGIDNKNFFAFYNLKIDAVEWVKKHPSVFFKEIAMINNKKYLTVSGWVKYKNTEEIESVYIANQELGSIYLKKMENHTKIAIKNEKLLNKAIEFHSKSNNIIPDDIDFSKISYNTFMSLHPIKYSALVEFNTVKVINITTTMSIHEIFNIKDTNTLINSEWWLGSKAISMPMN